MSKVGPKYTYITKSGRIGIRHPIGGYIRSVNTVEEAEETLKEAVAKWGALGTNRAFVKRERQNMKRFLCALCFVLGFTAGANAAETMTVSPAAAPLSTATLSLTFRVPEVLSITYTCATPDPAGDGSCDIPATAPVGTAVVSFTVNGAPAAFKGTPTFAEATGSFKLSGNSIVTAVSAPHGSELHGNGIGFAMSSTMS